MDQPHQEIESGSMKGKIAGVRFARRMVHDRCRPAYPIRASPRRRRAAAKSAISAAATATDASDDAAPAPETLQPLLEARSIRRKLGLTQPQFAKKLGVPVATVRVWERAETPADPVLQALLRILDRMPKSALRALDQTTRKAG